MNNPKRGEIYLVNFEPPVGAKIRKTRPALVLQNDIANRHSPTTIVAAVTSKFDETLYPTEVLVTAPEGGRSVDSVISLNQIRSIDKRRLARRLGAISSATRQRRRSAGQCVADSCGEELVSQIVSHLTRGLQRGTKPIQRLRFCTAMVQDQEVGGSYPLAPINFIPSTGKKP
jgi:mRNA interferase MazF